MAFQPKTVLSTDQELLDYFISFLKELRYEIPTFLKDCDVFIDNGDYGAKYINAVLFKTYGLADPDTVVWYYNNVGSASPLWQPDNSHTVLGGIEKDVWRVEPLLRLMVDSGLLHDSDRKRLVNLLHTANDEQREEETVTYCVETLSRLTKITEQQLMAFVDSHKPAQETQR